MKGRLARFGRSPYQLVILPGVMPVLGRTVAEAQAKLDHLQALIDPVLGLRLLADNLGDLDLSGYPLDGPLPEIPESNRSKSRRDLIIDLARRENLTIRQLYLRFATRGALVGTPESIADHLQQWFEGGAADGFNLIFPYQPGGLDDVVDLLLPELRRRGLFRTEYEGRTLRAHLGLVRPAHRSVASRGDR